jgi:type I restriction enzyme S subunit
VELGELLEKAEDTITVKPDQSYPNLGIYGQGRGSFTKPAISGASTSAEMLYRVRAGQFIYSRLFAFEGAYALVQPTHDGFFVSNEFPTFDVDRRRLLPDYLFAYFRRPTVWHALASQSTGLGNRRQRVHPNAVLAHRIPLPPVAEQQRLVTHLRAIEGRLVRAQELRKDQESEIQAALRSAFHRLEAHAEWKAMAEVAPLAWRQVTIDPEARYSEFGVRSFFKGIFLRRNVPGSTFSWQELYRLRAGDIVFSNIMAWEKAIAVAGPEHDGWVGNHRMLICEPRRDVVLPSCLQHYFMTNRGFATILQASPGTAARNKTLKADNLMAIQVPVPPMPQQLAFEALCQQVAQVRTARVTHAAEQTALLPSLLDRIFNS